MEAEPASEAFCFVCTSDVGHSPKEELALKVGISMFIRFKNQRNNL